MSATSSNNAGGGRPQYLMKNADGQLRPRITSQGNKAMAIPEDLFPVFCQFVTADGVWKRENLVEAFVNSHPLISMRQVSIKLADITTRNRPACVGPPTGKTGRAVVFYLRPRYYKYLRPEQRPPDWERYAEADEVLYQRQVAEGTLPDNSKKKIKYKKKEKKVTADNAAAAGGHAAAPGDACDGSKSMDDASGRGGGDDDDSDDDEVDSDDDDDVASTQSGPPHKMQRVENE